MSNPTTMVEQFNGSLGGFSGVDPIRHDSGLWLEEAGINYVLNPVAAVDATSWSAQANITISAEAALPGLLPGWLASIVTTGYKLTARQGWSMSTLGSTTRRIRAQFELRPAY
jgi:hypothetical protein